MRRSSTYILPSSRNSMSQEIIFSELLCTQNQIITPRDYSLDPAANQDLIGLIKKSVVFPNMTNLTLEELVEDMLVGLQQNTIKEQYFQEHQQFENFETNQKKKHTNKGETKQDDTLGENKPVDKSGNAANMPLELQLEEEAARPIEGNVLETNQEFTVDVAMKSIFVSETVANLNFSIQKTLFSDHEGIFFDDSWLIVMCELQSIKHRKVVIARLAYEMYIMPSCQAARCVVLILTHSDQRGMKGAIQTGTSFATIMSYPEFIDDLIRKDTPEAIVDQFISTIDNLEHEETRVIQEERDSEADMNFDDFEIQNPFFGIKEDVAKRFPLYFDDFSDGLLGYKTKQKLLAAIVFQYFATILPIIALGHSIDVITGHKLSSKTVIYSQFFGSIIYGLFSCNPMMMFQVSSVILLYCKTLYMFAIYNDHDFNLLFGLTCFFSGIFLILIGIFNLSNLMVYSRNSVADMIDFFQTITYIQNVYSDVQQNHKTYNCLKDKNPQCRPGEFVLNIFIMFLTITISIFFHGLHRSRLFSTSLREFLSDMGTPFGVIGSTIVSVVAFSSIEPTIFLYDSDANPFNTLDWRKISVTNMSTSFMLAIPLSMLIFLDHNLNMEFFADPNNKIHKGYGPHFDMLIIGIINAVFGVFGMCPMQGIFPNTPLHIKQMGDVAITHDQGIEVKTLIRVRDTRLTQLIVGILVGCSTFLLPLPLGYFPKSSLNGLLLVIGFLSIDGNTLVDRLMLFVTDVTVFPQAHPLRKVPVSVSHKFTVIQILQLSFISAISFSNIQFLTILFPLCLALLIPIRLVVLPKLFQSRYLNLLDPPKDTSRLV